MKKKDELIEVEPVRIPSLFGMKPGKWLTIVYFIILIILIFLVGFLPGILNGQKRVTFTSPAGNVAVYIDGRYAGGTEFTTWVESGEHKVEFKLYDNLIETASLEVGHPVFLTWLFPRSMKFEGTRTIDSNMIESINARFLSDVERQSAVLTYDDSHNYPPLFEDFANVCVNANITPSQDVLTLAFSFITSPQMLEDAKKAAGILGNTFDFSIQEALFTQENSGLTERFRNNQISRESTIKLADSNLDDMKGQKISSGEFSMGEKQSSFTYQESVSALVSESLSGSFFLSNSEITEYQYALFLQANPKWSKDNIETLKSDGLVDDFYLSGISTSLVFPSNKPVRNISYYAAQAYCGWISSLTGKSVFLPTEKQWTGAFSAIADPTVQKSLMLITPSGSLDSMLGGVWEFTSSSFIPLLRAYQVLDPRTAEIIEETGVAYLNQSDIIIKGGSEDANAVGVIGRNECSESVGFRIAWN